jgi:hypothetical protein
MLSKCVIIEDKAKSHGKYVDGIDNTYSLSTGHSRGILFDNRTLLYSINISTVLLLLLI